MPYYKGVYFAEVPPWAKKNPIVEVEDTTQELAVVPQPVEAPPSVVHVVSPNEPVEEPALLDSDSEKIETELDSVSAPLTVQEPVVPKKRKKKVEPNNGE
jgi:hypothetical protein